MADRETHCSLLFASLAFAHLASTAFRAISLRRSGESFEARILPPFDPPSFPNATAAGFFFLTMDAQNNSQQSLKSIRKID